MFQIPRSFLKKLKSQSERPVARKHKVMVYAESIRTEFQNQYLHKTLFNSFHPSPFSMFAIAFKGSIQIQNDVSLFGCRLLSFFDFEEQGATILGED